MLAEKGKINKCSLNAAVHACSHVDYVQIMKMINHCHTKWTNQTLNIDSIFTDSL